MTTVLGTAEYKKILAERMKVVGGKLGTYTVDAQNIVAIAISAVSVPVAME